MSSFQFSIEVSVQEKDVNARQHVSYDKYFLFFQDARIAYFATFGYDFDGSTRIGVIATEAHCTYKKELRLGDVITVYCRVREIKEKSFVMEFLIVRKDQICAEGSATFLYFDYSDRKVGAFPDQLIEDIMRYEGVGG